MCRAYDCPSLLPSGNAADQAVSEWRDVANCAPFLAHPTLQGHQDGCSLPLAALGSPSLSQSTADTLTHSHEENSEQFAMCIQSASGHSGGPQVPAVTDWVVTPDIKAKYDGYFEGIDKDHDGIVSGDEARHLFMASNLPHNVLAHIW